MSGKIDFFAKNFHRCSLKKKFWLLKIHTYTIYIFYWIYSRAIHKIKKFLFLKFVIFYGKNYQISGRQIENFTVQGQFWSDFNGNKCELTRIEFTTKNKAANKLATVETP